MKIWRLLYDEVFTIGYRKADKKKNLITGLNSVEFLTLPISKRYWYADPILFYFNNKHYLFYEAFDRITDKGVIAFSYIEEDGTLSIPKIILEQKYHLSYPFVFEIGKKIFMIPETHQNSTIELYEAMNFPLEWKRVEIIKEDIVTVDTTYVEYKTEKYLFTVKLDKRKGMKLVLFNLAENAKNGNLLHITTHPSSPLSSLESQARSAGKFIELDNELIRPAQDCSNNDYGRALVFLKIVELSREKYKEKEYKRIEPTDIKTNLKVKLRGVHTYALNDQFEVIDIKFRVFNFPLKYFRLFFRLVRKLK